jgi:hypothetical protein
MLIRRHAAASRRAGSWLNSRLTDPCPEATSEPDNPTELVDRRTTATMRSSAGQDAYSAIWSAIHVTGGSANVVLSRLPYTPTKGVISAMGRADSYGL